MAENKMEKLAELLGVEIDKPFNIKGYAYNPCKLTYNRMINKNNVLMYRDFFELLAGRLEIEKPILSDSEKDYLENVLRPFKDRIVYIEKLKSRDPSYEYIGFKIVYEDHRCPTNWCYLPYFREGTMYKNIELDKYYNLDEPGLFK